MTNSTSGAIGDLTEAVEALQSLRLGRPGTVVGSVKDSSAFMEAIYVSDAVDRTVESFFRTDSPSGELFILLGSAGDGKTAIFGRAYRASDSSWLKSEHLNLDATQSTSASRSVHEELTRFLDDTAKDIGEEDKPRRGLAINLGLALNYFRTENHKGRFQQIWEAIDAARDPENFDEGCIYRSGDGITVANLSHRRMFDTHPDSLGEGLLAKMVDRFNHENPSSPFNGLSERIEDASSSDPVAYNLHRLSGSTVRESVIRLLAAKAIISNEYLNPRRILDYLSQILVPQPLSEVSSDDGLPSFERLEESSADLEGALLWNSVYEAITEPGQVSAKLDPLTVFNLAFDEEILGLHAGQNSAESSEQDGVVQNLSEGPRSRTTIRMRHLRNQADYQTEERNPTFREFAGARTVLDNLWVPGDQTGEVDGTAVALVDRAYDTVVNAIKRWTQSTGGGNLVEIGDGKESLEYRFLAEWQRKTAEFHPMRSTKRTTDETQLGKIWFEFENEVAIPLSYELYRLLSLIEDGFNPSAVDPEESEGVRLLHSQLSQFTDKNDELVIHDTGDEIVLRFRTKTGYKSGIQVSES